jgi:hypothetical protein
MSVMIEPAPPSGLPAISPSRGEIGSCYAGDWLISPLEGEMAGRPEGGERPTRTASHG